MVDSSESLVCCVKEGKVVGIRGHIAVNKFDGSCGRLQFALEGLSWSVKDVSEEHMGSSIMKESDEDSADAYGALIRSELDDNCIYIVTCITYTCKNNDFAA
jgi:hypothetical protein